MHTIGIDPGYKGAIVHLSPSGRVLGAWDAPVQGTSAKPVGHDAAECRAILQSILMETEGRVTVALEDIAKIVRIPGRTIPATALWGSRCFWLGLCEGLGLTVRLIGPKKWQKAMYAGLPGDLSKDAKAVQAARQRWREDELELIPARRRVPRVDRAEAALIAEFVRLERLGI